MRDLQNVIMRTYKFFIYETVQYQGDNKYLSTALKSKSNPIVTYPRILERLLLLTSHTPPPAKS